MKNTYSVPSYRVISQADERFQLHSTNVEYLVGKLNEYVKKLQNTDLSAVDYSDVSTVAEAAVLLEQAVEFVNRYE